jgi:hypothetical protein
MPLTCLQCAMKAMLAGEPPPMFDESPKEHLKRVHPDPYATYRERQMLEAELFKRGVIPADPETP